MAYELILVEVAEGIATISINRPSAMNALNPAVLAELDQAFRAANDDDNVKCVILTGAGDKAFVAGADIAAMVDMDGLAARAFSRLGQELLFFMEAMDKPIIAAVNGFALGGGTEIAMACDFIYASEKAKFGQPEITLGIIPGFGGTQRLTRLVGKGWAKELCMTGAIIGAEQAKEIGLVNKVFPPDQLMAEVMKTAKQITKMGRASMRAIKYLVNSGYDMPLERAIPMEADCFAVCYFSPDQKEGMGAFLGKRKPDFKGGK